MNTESGKKTKWLATTSLILGILSTGLVLFAFIPIIWARLTGGPDARLLALGWLALFLMMGGFIMGIAGCITAVIALRNKEEGNKHKIKGLASIGLVLSIVGVAPFLIVFGYALLSLRMNL